MMGTGKMVGAMVTLVIIAPILLGFIWPSDARTVDDFVSVSETDLTGSLANDQIPVWQDYDGTYNNAFIGIDLGGIDYRTVPTPVETSETKSNVRELVRDSRTQDTMTTGDSFTPASTTVAGAARIDLVNAGLEWMWNGNPVDTVSYYPGNGITVVSAEGDFAATIPSTDEIDVVTGGTYEKHVYKYGDEYVDESAGYIAGGGEWSWTNGFVNRAVTIWITAETTSGSWEIDSFGDPVTLGLSSGMWTLTDGTDTLQLGNTSAYPIVALTWDSHAGEVTAEGLVRADDFADTDWTVGNSVSLPTTSGPASQLMMTVLGTLHYRVMSTVSQIGTMGGMIDVSVEPDAYYPDTNWQLYMRSPAVYGGQIVMGGTAYDISREGTIQLTVLDVEEGEDPLQTVSIRDMTILSVVTEGSRHVWVSGLLIDDDAPGDWTVQFRGAWLMDLLIYDMDVEERTVYDWRAGAFNLDQTSFCMVGLLSSFLAFLAFGLYGRWSGAKILPLLVVWIMTSAVYLILIP